MLWDTPWRCFILEFINWCSGACFNTTSGVKCWEVRHDPGSAAQRILRREVGKNAYLYTNTISKCSIFSDRNTFCRSCYVIYCVLTSMIVANMVLNVTRCFSVFPSMCFVRAFFFVDVNELTLANVFPFAVFLKMSVLPSNWSGDSAQETSCSASIN